MSWMRSARGLLSIVMLIDVEIFFFEGLETRVMGKFWTVWCGFNLVSFTNPLASGSEARNLSSRSLANPNQTVIRLAGTANYCNQGQRFHCKQLGHK